MWRMNWRYKLRVNEVDKSLIKNKPIRMHYFSHTDGMTIMAVCCLKA